jgi:PAS domain-containing protein
LSNQVKNKDKNQSGSEKGWYTYAIILDIDARIKFITKPLAAKLGYTVSELLSKDAINLFIEDDEKEDRRSQLDFLYKQESVIDAFDLHLKNHKSEIVNLRFSILKLGSENNATEDLAFICDDLDTTKKIKSNFVGSEAQLAELVDSAKEFIIIIDGNEVVKTVNHAGKSKLGVQKGMKFRDLLEPSAFSQTTTFLNSLSKISSTSNINLVFVNPKTNQSLNLDGTVSTIVENNKLQEFRLVLHDITEQVKTEKAKDLYYSIAHHSIHSKNLDELYLNIHKELKQVVDCENLYIALLDNSSDSTIIDFPYYRDIENILLNSYQRKFGR